MNRNMILTFVGLFLLVVIGAGGAYWAYKKYRQKQNLEYVSSGKMEIINDNFDVDAFKNEVLNEELLGSVIEKHQLASVWGLADETAVKERIKQKFTVTRDDKVVTVSYRDRDPGIAERVLKTIMITYGKRPRNP